MLYKREDLTLSLDPPPCPQAPWLHVLILSSEVTIEMGDDCDLLVSNGTLQSQQETISEGASRDKGQGRVSRSGTVPLVHKPAKVCVHEHPMPTQKLKTLFMEGHSGAIFNLSSRETEEGGSLV